MCGVADVYKRQAQGNLCANGRAVAKAHGAQAAAGQKAAALGVVQVLGLSLIHICFGHKAGFDRLKEITRYAVGDCGIKVLSLYVFSTENFAREDVYKRQAYPRLTRLPNRRWVVLFAR